MTDQTVLVCEKCGAGHEAGGLRVACDCGGLLEARHPAPELNGDTLRQRFDARVQARAGLSPAGDLSGVWRFQEMVMPAAAAAARVSHPEGNTPLLHRPALAGWTGASRLMLKHEGYNPTGSFKDRGMTVALSQAKRAGARAVACASTGNTSASLAAYAALAGIPALVLVPAGQVAMGKLAQSLAYGARTLVVRGDFDACLRLVREASETLGVYLVNSINPWRIEGQKTIVLETLQQLDWQVPDWIVVPAGNLGNTSAFGAALRQARQLGLIDRIPRIAAVQAAGAAPFAASFRDGFRERFRVEAHTVATAIRIGDPASHHRAVRAIRETDGVVLDVSDDEILEAKAAVDASGVGCEPASAASVAGVRRLVTQGVIDPEERVVAVLTGHVLKDPGILLEHHAPGSRRPGANPPVEIEADIRSLESVLRSADGTHG
jgi:threonine synthase